jgi:hypothetical protein
MTKFKVLSLRRFEKDTSRILQPVNGTFVPMVNM